MTASNPNEAWRCNDYGHYITIHLYIQSVAKGGEFSLHIQLWLLLVEQHTTSHLLHMLSCQGLQHCSRTQASVHGRDLTSCSPLILSCRSPAAQMEAPSQARTRAVRQAVR